MNQIRAISNDTFDAVAYRYSVDLIDLLEANAQIQDVILQQYQLINLPEKTTIQVTQTLKLWD
ncbi:hypothetical protein [Acinetobacter piscicola]|uniref:hypothetical protein n=1 Tax=Acinetobacter piscicola TaxID=2006115 RepID=UPI00101F2A8F|nr:hypothetical protein [Acinetobacter piscicola]RYL25906.1 hypothetical protein EWP19_10665 [Acinetobacter piscicola]